LAPVNYAAGANPTSVIIGDFNGNGKLDLITTNASRNNVSVFMGNGDDLATQVKFGNSDQMQAYAYANKGMHEESIKEMEQLAISDGEHDLAETMKIAYARGGYQGALKSRLKYYKDRRKAGFHVNFWDEALTHTQLGNRDLALQALEKAYDEREDLTDLAVNPSWDSIRADPHFQDLLRHVGLPVNGAGVVEH
jgi:tetratricopeptide (TPR) repeat protein